MRMIASQLAKALYELMKSAKNKAEEKKVTAAFVRYLAKKNLLVALPKIGRELEALEKKEKGILDVQIVSAHTLGRKERESVVQAASRYFEKAHNRLDVRFQEDPSLLGGLLIKTNEALIDMTLRNSLRRLSKRLVR